ncbi:MAG: hypothetical protein WD468_05915, partial [Pirellulales bacterium]
MRIELNITTLSKNSKLVPGFAAAVVVAASCLCSTGAVQAQDDVAPLVEQARGSFQPVTAEQVSAARAELNQRMGDLERFIRPSSANGQQWIKYLKWDAAKEAVAAQGTPNLTELDTTLDRLNRDENGLELPKFRAVADALRRYRDLAAV